MSNSEVVTVRAIGVPVPQGSKNTFKRGDRVVIVDVKSARLKAWRNVVAAACPNVMWLGGVGLKLEFIMPRPKTVKRVNMTVPPDIDKLSRAVLDALTGKLFKDDSQVTDLHATKRYQQPGEQPGAIVTMRNTGEG